MNIAIFAAGGNVGRRITQEALQRGHHVTAVVRDPARSNLPNGAIRVVQGDATDSASVAAVIDGSDAIVSAVGPTDQTDSGTMCFLWPPAASSKARVGCR